MRMRMLFYRRRMWNHLITFDVTLALLFFYNLQEFSTPLDCDGSCMVYTLPINTKKKNYVANLILHHLEKFGGGRTHACHRI